MAGNENEFEKMMAEQKALTDEMEDRMNRSMGRRSTDQAFRAEVDEEMLAGTDPTDEYDWSRALGYLGLDALDPADAAMPAALRALLTVNDDDPDPPLAWVGMALAAAFVVGGTGYATWTDGWSSLLLLLPGVFVTALGFVGGMGVDAGLRAIHILTPAKTPADKRDAALAALRETPFVKMISGKLVENVPTLSWLKSRQAELHEAGSHCEDQVREIDEILERTKELEAKLGEHEATAQERALHDRKTQIQVLHERVGALAKKLAERQEAQEAGLAKVRTAAELTSLRDRSAALLGEQPKDDASRIAADLELDVADLAKQFAAVKGDLADQENRWKAEAEVAGLAR